MDIRRPNIYAVHIMTAGSGVYETFRKALRSGQFRLDEIFILAERKVFSRNITNIKLKEIAKSIKNLQKYCGEENIPIKIIKFDSYSIDAILNSVIDISKRTKEESTNEKLEYYCNTTGGTKIASMGLFLASIWIDATPYYFYIDEKEPLLLKVPKFKALDITKNPNYLTILQTLDERKEGCSNTEIRRYMEKSYKVLRKSRSSGKLTMGNLSKMLRKLEEWDLISIEEGKSRRENLNMITNDGRLILKMM
jgi:hypothetical protein